MHSLFQPDLQTAKFIYFIAVEGEDNQNKAEAMLKQNPQLNSWLILAQRELTDAAGRHFLQPMSAYEYAFWACDTRMCRMMEKYMDDKTKVRALEQCKNIEVHGIGFILNGEQVENSKHFDFQPIIDAYNPHIAAMEAIRGWIHLNYNEIRALNEQQLKLGKEQAKVPTHVAQEYCSAQLFFPVNEYVEALKTLDFNRTVRFGNQISGADELWFLRGMVNPSIGGSCSICKRGGVGQGVGFWNYQLSGLFGFSSTLIFRDRASRDNLRAITALSQERAINDIKQTLENLKPACLEFQLSQQY